MKKIVFFLLLLSIPFFSGCNEDNNDLSNPAAPQVQVTDEEFARNFGSEVERDFVGQIIDVNHNPIPSATVRIGSTTVSTDVNGVFIINQATVYEKFAHITATKPGYINGSRSLVPTQGKNNVKIILLPAAATQVISSGESQTVDLTNNTKVVFDGAFEDANGNAYSGNVNVAMYHLETSNENLAEVMPGMLYAKSETGQPVGLETFGMLNVQLTGSGGQMLQIASGHTAQISMKIDDTQTATAPSTILLWHFDEVNGYWRQEGSATRQGNQYVGNVSHFSWWNCDAPFPTDSLTVTVTDAAGLPLKNIGVGIIRQNSAQISVSFTDNNGQVSGMVPSNEPLVLKIYDPCGNVVKEVAILPMNQSTQVNITLENTEIISSIVKGKLVKCDGSNVDNGYVILQFGAQMMFSEVTDGNFQFVAVRCEGNDSFSVRGYDLDAFQSTGNLSNSFGSQTELGIIPVCSAISEYIVYQIDDHAPTYIFDNIDTFPVPGSGILTIRVTGMQNVSFAMHGNTTTPGIYTGTEFYMGLTNFEGWGYHSYNYSPGTTQSMETQILKYGNVGEYIDIRFHHDGNSSDGSPYILDGYVHVLRD